MNFDQFIETAWNDHADQPQEVADRLAVALPMVVAAEHVAPFARIVTHVYGEHLGEWQGGIALLEALRRTQAVTDAPTTNAAVTRGVATLRYAGGDVAAIAPLSAEDRAAVLATASSALAGRAGLRARAQRLRRSGAARRQAAQGIACVSRACRHRQQPVDGAREAHRPRCRADGGHAGGGPRRPHVLATCRHVARGRACAVPAGAKPLAAGQPAEAVESAKQCAEVCMAHDAPAFERFFAYAVLARALRDDGREVDYADMREEALAWFERVPEDERQWCESDLAELAY